MEVVDLVGMGQVAMVVGDSIEVIVFVYSKVMVMVEQNQNAGFIAEVSD